MVNNIHKLNKLDLFSVAYMNNVLFMIEHASIYEQFPKRDMNPTYQEVFTRASCYVTRRHI